MGGVPVTRLCAWDIEIAAIIPDGHGVNWSDYRPYGVTCAAIWLWPGGQVHTFAPEAATADGPYDARMSVEACRVMFNILQDHWTRGFDVVTWNGGYFDFDCLAEECGRHADVVALALRHVDPGLQMLRELGFMCGLAAAAEGCGLGGKLMEGKMAPIKWATRDREQQDEVLEYVQQDARLTGQVYLHIMNNGSLPYYSKRHGTLEQWIPKGWRSDNRLFTVAEVASLTPPPRPWKTYEEATAWMNKE